MWGLLVYLTTWIWTILSVTRTNVWLVWSKISKPTYNQLQSKNDRNLNCWFSRFKLGAPVSRLIFSKFDKISASLIFDIYKSNVILSCTGRIRRKFLGLLTKINPFIKIEIFFRKSKFIFCNLNWNSNWINLKTKPNGFKLVS